MTEISALAPSQFISIVSDTIAMTFESVLIEGEVASFKVNQGKWVFFDIKDEEASVPCFMPVWSLRQPLEDGMKVVVRGTPKLTKWGKFSLTVSAVQPKGEGSLKKAFEMLKKKLADEGRRRHCGLRVCSSLHFLWIGSVLRVSWPAPG